MAAIGAGAQAKVQEQIRSFGANVLMVNPNASNRGGAERAAMFAVRLTIEDASAIAELDAVRDRRRLRWRGAAQVVHGSLNWGTTVNGTTRDHFAIRGWTSGVGAVTSPPEEEQGRRQGGGDRLGGRAKIVCGRGSAWGRSFGYLNAPFEVIGVLQGKGTAGVGDSQDDVVFVPLLTARMRLIGSANTVNRDAVAYILASANSEQTIPVAIEEIDDLLQQRHSHGRGQGRQGFAV